MKKVIFDVFNPYKSTVCICIMKVIFVFDVFNLLPLKENICELHKIEHFPIFPFLSQHLSCNISLHYGHRIPTTSIVLWNLRDIQWINISHHIYVVESRHVLERKASRYIRVILWNMFLLSFYMYIQSRLIDRILIL